jgi:ribonuclease Z
MSWLVQPRLINEPFSDPGVYVDFRHGRRAILFDLGDVSALSARELMRVSHVFVSHAHLDHFAGFDRLLRVCLHRPEPLHLLGPPGFPDQVAARLRSYTWNLLGADSIDFRMVVRAFEDERVGWGIEFRARDAFRGREAAAISLPRGRVLDEEPFSIEAATLDHGIPCLAFALVERMRVNVWRGALERLGLPTGPWLNEAKSAVRQNRPDDTLLAVGAGRTVALGDLRAEALRVGPGQKIAYVTDAACTAENVSRIVALARDADELFIEAAFVEEDATVAAERCHLTAAQAGRIGRSAGARHLVPFHHSARYLDRPDALAREALLAFGAAPAPPG